MIKSLLFLLFTITLINKEENKLDKFINKAIAESKNISEERKVTLDEIASYIKNKSLEDKDINALFICTHNSRRSQFSQVLSLLFAEHLGIKRYNSFSGGTEATAFNPRAINALLKEGFTITKLDEEKNPKYKVSFSHYKRDLIMFSKVFSSKENPQKDFIAIPVCSQADESCPIVFGAEERIYLGYEDPKKSDGTEKEAEEYRKTLYLIASEMAYIFGKVAG